MKVAVAVSGGVDSLAALALLKKAGCEVFGLHGLFTPEASVPQGLREACAAFGASLHVADLREAFAREVVAKSGAALAAGKTPNPCVFCNRAIKYGALLDRAAALGADRLATGHYVRFGRFPGGRAAPLAHPSAKDQSYFLGLVPGERFGRALFPLAALAGKQMTREVARQAGILPPSERESQDICFGISSKGAPGPVLLASRPDEPLAKMRQIGVHDGLARYTPGQRKGLGIPWREPLYVLKKQANALVVAPARLLNMGGLLAGGMNYFLPLRDWPKSFHARTRHRQPLQPCVCAERGREPAWLEVHFEAPVFPTAPGQLAAFYDSGGRLLGAGVTEEVFFTGAGV